MRILIFLLLASFSSFAQLLNNNIMVNGGSVFPVHKLSVRYNTTPYSYITSKTGYNGDATFNSGANVIGVAALTASGNNNGLCYDAVNDRIVSKIGNNNEFITREDFATAAAAAYGTIPTFDHTVAGTNSHGTSIDPLTGNIYESQGNQQFKIFDSGGSLISTETVTDVPQFSMTHYDWPTGILYTTPDGASGRVYGVKDDGTGTWELVYTSDFLSADGVTIDYWNNKIVVNHSARMRWQDSSGINIIMLPPATTQTQDSYNGIFVDRMDQTVWYNTHGDNTLTHADPLGKYRQYFNNHMFNWEDWNLGNNSFNGFQYSNQILIGRDWSIGPIIDFDSNTGQQTLGNWDIPGPDNALLEFRGSGTAPTTTPQGPTDYLPLQLYDPNDTNEGWGATSPGAWQSTPTTDRYMQVRIKPQGPDAPSDQLSPLDLGSDLIAWYSTAATEDGETGEYVSAYFDALGIAGTANQIRELVNIADPNYLSNFNTQTASTRPLLTSGYASMEAANRQLNSTNQTDLLSMVQALGECEIHIIGVKPAATSNAIYFSLAQSSSNNNRVILRHYGSAATPANMLGFQTTDGAGSSSIYGVVDASGTTARLLTFKFGASANSLYINNVSQTITVDTGTNSGQQFNDYTTTHVATGRVLSNTNITGATRMYEIVITEPLTDQEREDYIMDYFAAKGLITP